MLGVGELSAASSLLNSTFVAFVKLHVQHHAWVRFFLMTYLGIDKVS